MKVYLETTVPNFLYADDSPDKQAETIAFWDWLKLGTENTFISRLVEQEILRAPADLRTKLFESLAEVSPQMLDVSAETVGLGRIYVAREVVPAKYENDAYHIAVAVCSEMDVVVSWNLEHIVKMKTIRRVNEINVEYGLPPIRIHTPPEVMP